MARAAVGSKSSAAAKARVSPEALSRAVLDVRLSERDRRLLWALYRYKVLRGDHIRQLCYYDLGRIRAAREQRTRPGKLAEAGFIVRGIEAHHKTYYWLGELGRRWLGEQGVRATPVAAARLHHDLMVADFMVAAWAEVQRLGARFTWQSEVEMTGKLRSGITPDALGFAELVGQWRLVFNFEADRGTESPRAFGTKVRGYSYDLQNGGWQKRLERKTYPPVLVVTRDERDDEGRIKDLMQAVARQMGEDERQKLAWFFTSQTKLDRYVGVLGLEYNYGPLQAPVWTKLGEQGQRSIIAVNPEGATR